MKFDAIIKHGFVVDGSGAAGEVADIGITGKYISAIGDLSGAEADEIVEGAGKVVCPGFIDVHVHSELALLGGQDRYAPLLMGVTTQLAGPDGFSWAPLEGSQLSGMRDYYRTFYDQSAIQSADAMSIAQLLDIWRGHIPSNIALQVPHAAIRLAVMGWEARSAKEEELRQMEVIARQWHEAGAKAFATGLEYEPMRHADLRELLHFSRIARQYGGIYVAHQRGYGDNVKTGCSETFAVAREAGIPVHISHFTVDDQAGQLVDEALREGIDVTFDMYPYPAGCTSLLFSLPHSLQSGSIDEVRERLKRPEVRLELERHLDRTMPADRMVFASVGIVDSGYEGKSVSDVQKERGGSLAETVCSILLESNFQSLMIYHWTEDRYRFLQNTYQHPCHMVSTDGVYAGKKPHPRGFGTFPKVIRQFVYDNGWLTLEQAIYKMTGFPARRFQLEKRGMLKTGHYADIVIFDPNSIKDGPTFAEPRKPNSGIEEVWVNGRPAIRKGVALAGDHGMLI